jgi:putative ABC transport system permease protein
MMAEERNRETSLLRALAGLTWRESRTARRRLLLYMSAISLGSAALVAIDSFAGNVTRSVREQSRALLGGDAAFSTRRPATDKQKALLDSVARATRATYARVVTFPSMALVTRTGATRLSQVRAVSSNYPFYGEITTTPTGQWPRLQAGQNALVDPALLIALRARVGDTLNLGYGRFTIIGTLKDVPGTPGIAEMIGPRVFIPERYLAETQLLVFGSIAEHAVFARIPAGSDAAKAMKPFRDRLRKAEIRTRTVSESEEEFTGAIDQLSRFIGIVGLVALLLGGVGVASGVRAFVARKIDTVAILRCLGASSEQVLAMYVAQAAAMGIVGAVAGAALGVAVQFALPSVFRDLLPVDVSVTLEPRAIFTGIAIGGWIALIFALRPLLALRNVSPLQTLRRDADSEVLRMRWNDLPRILVNLLLLASVVSIALLRSATAKQGAWMGIATIAAISILTASAVMLSFVARKSLRKGWPYVVRQGVANLYRPANQTRSVVLSLGFGAFLITTLYLVQSNLLGQFNIGAEASKANLVLFDVQEDQQRSVDSLVRAHRHTVLQVAPVVTMRIASINGRTVDQIAGDTARPRAAADSAQNPSRRGQRRPSWALRREYRSTYRARVMGGERVVAGKWFSQGGEKHDTGEVSMEQEVAKELRIKVGDVVTWNVQGVMVPTRVTSLREVTWMRFEPNFFAVFATGVLDEAPKQFILLADVHGPRAVAELQRDVVSRYPNVSSLDLSVIRESVAKIVDRVSSAVRFMALFSLAMGIPVLFAAVAATRRDRIREGVLLKTLGATRAQIIRIMLAEYVLLGVLGSLTGMVLAFGGGWAITHFVFDNPYAPALGPAAAIALAMLVLTVTIGLLAGRDVFRETPMSALRES